MSSRDEEASEITNTGSTIMSGISDAAQLSKEQPVFDIEQVQLQFSLNHSLHKLCVKNNIMYLLEDIYVYKISLENPSEVKQLLLPSGTDSKIIDSWLHPNGLHLVIRTSDSNYYYLHESYSNFKLLPRFKNMDIKFMVFPNSQEYRESTGDFLIGTKDGSVYIGHIKHNNNGNDKKKDDKYVKLVYKQQQPIFGLTYANNDLQINIFTSNQLLMWDCFDNSYSELMKVFKMKPKTVPLPKSNNLTPVFVSNDQYFAYLVSPTHEIHSNDPELYLSKTEKLNFLNDSASTYSNSLIISPHHLISLNKNHDKLYIHNKLANSKPTVINVKEHLLKSEKLLGITADYAKMTYWLYSSNNIYELVINNESTSVWYNYYKLGKYEKALECLEDPDSKNFFKKDMVLVKQGYDYLQKGGFGIDFVDEDIDQDLFSLQVKGIKILGQLSEPFEKVCLMLLNLQQPLIDGDRAKRNYSSEKLLVEYLLMKFKLAKTVERSRIRVIVLSTWIIELMLRTTYALENEVKLLTSLEAPMIQKEDSFQKNFEKKKSMLNSLNSLFENFLSQNYKILDAGTVYQIIGDLHYPSKLIYFAELIQDYEFILNYYIDIEDWNSSLKTLVKIYTVSETNNVDIIYKKSTILLINSPKLTVETWLKFPSLNYEKLLPAILIYNKNNHTLPLADNHSIPFLLKIIFDKGIKDKTVNNCYLSLLITYPIKDDDTRKRCTRYIVRFLNYAKTEPMNNSKKFPLYSADFILRLCINYKQYQAAVIILINDMGLYEQALKLSLNNGLTELAEFVLKKYEGSILNNGQLELIGDDYELVYNKSEPGDINSVSKIKLEEDNFSSRKKLLMMFAKYIIDGICQGKEFEVLNIVDDDKESNILVSQDNEDEKQNGDPVQDVTNNLVDSMRKVDNLVIREINLSKLSKALRYLLNLSFGNNSDSSIITLKDLLPLFPESIMINNFKDEIVKSLNQYNTRINQLSSEMQESLNITHKLKSQIKESKQKEARGKIYTIIEPGEPCKLCQNLLINKNFVCFPNCHHNFHKDCLVKYYLKLKSDYRFKKIFQNFKKNASVSNKQELDDIMLKECVLCNDGNISTIDANIIDIDRNKAELQEWEL